MSKKLVGIRLSEDKAKKLKIYLANEDKSLQEFLEEYIDAVLDIKREEEDKKT